MNKKENFDLYKLIEQKKKWWPFVLFGLLVVFASSVLTLADFGAKAINLYSSTIGYKNEMLGRLTTLIPDMTIQGVSSGFGNPTFINELADKNVKDYVFVNKYFYMDVVANLDGKVKQIAVTTRDKNFNPTFSAFQSPKSPGMQVTLGKTTYGDLGTDGLQELSYCGYARRASYHEIYYFGAGLYRNIVVANNIASYQGYSFYNKYLDDKHDEYCDEGKSNDPADKLKLADSNLTDEQKKLLVNYELQKAKLLDQMLKDDKVKAFRGKTVIDTYIITSSMDFYHEGYGYGVDPDQVSLIGAN